jgi:hypothetical protein
MGLGTSRRLLKSNTKELPLQDGNGQQECQFDQRSGEQRHQSNEQTHHYSLMLAGVEYKVLRTFYRHFARMGCGTSRSITVERTNCHTTKGEYWCT